MKSCRHWQSKNLNLKVYKEAVLERETNGWCHFNGNCPIASKGDSKVQQWRRPGVAQAVASGDKLKWTSSGFVQSVFKKSLLDFAKHRTAQTRREMCACVKSPEASRLNFFCQTCSNLNKAVRCWHLTNLIDFRQKTRQEGVSCLQPTDASRQLPPNDLFSGINVVQPLLLIDYDQFCMSQLNSSIDVISIESWNCEVQSDRVGLTFFTSSDKDSPVAVTRATLKRYFARMNW